MNDLEKHIKNLEEYCEEDNLFEKDGDFKEFCDNHIADIQAVIQELRNIQSDLYEANNRINDLLDTVKQKDEIIDEMAKTMYLELPIEWYYKWNIEPQTQEQIKNVVSFGWIGGEDE